MDDDIFIHEVTELSLGNFVYGGRPLELIRAFSGREAREIMARENNIAVGLIDVVMETDDAGLQLVDYIRKELGNEMVRLVIRTGQPGNAPEREVIERYDIDDYKDKTELTAQKLFTTMRSALKAYRDLKTIEGNRRGLSLILDATPRFYLEEPSSINAFYSGVLTQIVGLCNIDGAALIGSGFRGFIATVGDCPRIRARIGEFSSNSDQQRVDEINAFCAAALTAGRTPDPLAADSLLFPLSALHQVMGYVYLEGVSRLSEGDRHLVQVMANQVGAALKTHALQDDLREANHQALYMLAVASEHKDEDTGAHIKRLSEGTRMLALRLGVDEALAARFAEASVLHDIGKLGVPDAILQKPARLTEEEFNTIKQHAAIGEGILSHSYWFELARECAASHHERWDGTGYPRGLQGEEISLIGRIVAVMDVFDALSHARPYKEAWTIERSVAEIEKGAGTQFDPRVVEAFLSMHDEGKLVDLL